VKFLFTIFLPQFSISRKTICIMPVETTPDKFSCNFALIQLIQNEIYIILCIIFSYCHCTCSMFIGTEEMFLLFKLIGLYITAGIIKTLLGIIKTQLPTVVFNPEISYTAVRHVSTRYDCDLPLVVLYFISVLSVFPT